LIFEQYHNAALCVAQLASIAIGTLLVWHLRVLSSYWRVPWQPSRVLPCAKC
jgi:hypothetical protein